MKNPITAIKEGNCKLDKPLMACPDVHPPAYLEPNPTINPPNAKIKKPFKLNTASHPNNYRSAHINIPPKENTGNIPPQDMQTE